MMTMRSFVLQGRYGFLMCFAVTIAVGFLSGGATGQTSPTPSVTPVAANSSQTKESGNRPPENLPINPPEPQGSSKEWAYLSSREFILALMVTILTLAALSMQFLLLRSASRIKPQDSLRIFGVILIILGTLFLITAGFSSQQMAPALGLFGTIAGYLLGRADRKGEEKHEESS